jgi:hypothetical protein
MDTFKEDTLRGKILDLCNKAGLTLAIEPTLETRNRSESDEMKGTPLSFSFRLQSPKASGPDLHLFTGTYSAGVGIADRWALDQRKDIPTGLGGTDYVRRVLQNPREHRTVDGARILRQCRARYRPTIVDVVAALVCDASFAQEYDSWEDMAEGSGAELKTAEDLRKAQRDYMACKDACRFLARAFRSNVAMLADLCRDPRKVRVQS